MRKHVNHMLLISNEYDSSIGFENNFDCWSYGYLFYVVGMEIDET